MPLSERVPVLEHMGFTVVDESTYHAEPAGHGAQQLWLHDMLLAFTGDGAVDFDAVRGKLDDCFAAVMCADAENDGYNALVLRTGLAWREVALVRTLSRYLRQIGVPYSQDYMWSTLVRHADLAAKIVALFETRFDPHLGVDAGRTREAPGRRPRRHRGRARGGRRASMRTASCAISSTR